MADVDQTTSVQQAAITKLWRIRKTVAQMLDARGYVVAHNFLNESKSEFEAQWQQTIAEGGGRERFVILVSHKVRFFN